MHFDGFSSSVIMDNRALSVLVLAFFCLLLSANVSYGTSSDIYCLETLKKSVKDPLNYLNNSWNFNNDTEGFICKFTGIDCWHPDENKVLNIRLSDMGLQGQFPKGLENCTSMTGLDLSSNELSGSIPSNISKILPYLTSLDLSSNNFSGEIPVSLSNLTYLNVLKLDNNRLMGQIPPQFGKLNRLKTFSVTNNLLTGQIPTFVHKIFTDANFANNPGLCGKPLEVCKEPRPKSDTPDIFWSAAIGGLCTSSVATVTLFFSLRCKVYCWRGGVSRKKEKDLRGSKVELGARGTKISMLEELVAKMRLRDLMKATNDFSKDNIIGSGRMGTMYKAMLLDGSSLAVKRLQDTQRFEKQFASELRTLGSVRHRNLVPLLGFCITEKEKLLVYKYMSNGTLYDQLHQIKYTTKVMEWPLRLRIGIGLGRGLAWLHHNCIIHNNISLKCILLDENFEPQISNFGHATLMNSNNTRFGNFAKGEFENSVYVAPEYKRKLATPKGDVYSFGIVLLELVTGQKPTQVSNSSQSFNGSLVEWITHLSNSSDGLYNAVDKSLMGKGFDGEIFEFLRVALNCVISSPKERPTVPEVYQILRAMGEKYNFIDDDEIFIPPDNVETHGRDELSVGQTTKEIQ